MIDRDMGLPEAIGLVSGGRKFPMLCAKRAREKGHKVFAICHKGETLKELQDYCHAVKWIHLGQLGKIISFFKKHQVSHCFFAGTIDKKRLFVDIRPDIRALNLWRKMKGHLDDGILRAFARELESEGIEVISPTLILDDILFPEGTLTKSRPSREELEDVSFGLEMARKIGSLDIGQCVVVKDKVVLAVEAIEGTDETIKRGGLLSRGGAVIVKVCKPNQDTRFDLPAVGKTTIETMKSVGARVLAVEAQKALFFEKEEAIKLADEAGIAILGIS